MGALTLTQVLYALGTVFAGLGAIFAWAFVWHYRHDNWRKYDAGVHLMRFTFGLAVILTYIVAFNLIDLLVVDPHPFLDGFVVACRLMAFAWVAWQLGERDVMLRIYQRDSESTQLDDDTPITDRGSDA